MATLNNSIIDKSKAYNILPSDISKGIQYYDESFLVNEKIYYFIMTTSKILNRNKSDIPYFHNAIREHNVELRDALLDKVYLSRKADIESERLLHFPEDIYFRTPLLDTFYNKLKFSVGDFKIPKFIVKDKFLYLYKAISLFQLPFILQNGLHSKFGGIGGADRDIDLQEWDRGKMYVGLSPNNATFFLERITCSLLIRIKIPTSMSYDINLATSIDNSGFLDNYFIGIIEPKYISVYMTTKDHRHLEIESYYQNLMDVKTIENITKYTIENLYDYEIKNLLRDKIELSMNYVKYFTKTQLKSLSKEDISYLISKEYLTETQINSLQ